MDNLSTDQIITLINQQGFAWLISLISILFVVSYMKRILKQQQQQQMALTGKIHMDAPHDYDIQRHSLLNTLERFYLHNVHVLCFTNPFKQLLWTDFLKTYFQAMHEYISRGLERDMHRLPDEEFRAQTELWLTELFPYCEAQVKKELEQYLQAPNTQNVIPIDIILKKFRIVVKDKNAVFFIMLNELTDTRVLLNNKQRLGAILYALKGILYLIMQQVEHTLQELNGDLQGYTYKHVVNNDESPTRN